MAVLLSTAKHLQYLVENKHMQILRCAQDDSITALFRSLFSPAVRTLSRGSPCAAPQSFPALALPDERQFFGGGGDEA